MSELAALPAPSPLAPFAARTRALSANPAVRRARPALIVIAALAAAALAVMALRQPEWRPLYPGLAEADAATVSDALAAANFQYRINADTGTVEVPAGDSARARILLAGQGLPKSSAGNLALDDMPLGASRSVEAARLKAALERELAQSVEAIDGVKAARVHVASPEPSVFIRDRAAPSASVFITLAPGRSLSESQVRAVIWLVATSIPGLASDRVSVVDQSGTLLSAGVSGDAQHLAYQQRLESLVRERLVKLLTPLLGPQRFTAEVAADVDFSENEAASERFQPAGSVRSEQTSRNSEAAPPPAAGIPGALTNTVPQAALITAAPPAIPAAIPPAAPPVVTAETAARNFEIGKDVSVTRAGAPRLKRLSVAVVVDVAALGKNGAKDLGNLQRLVRGAVGFDAARGDLVEVQIRAFASQNTAPAVWYEAPAIREYAVTAAIAACVLIAAGIGFFLWRRRTGLAAAAGLAADAATAVIIGRRSAPSLFAEGTADKAAVEAMIDGGELLRPAAARDYSGKLDIARTLVTGDRDRAMAVARQMLLADLGSTVKPPSPQPAADEEAAA